MWQNGVDLAVYEAEESHEGVDVQWRSMPHVKVMLLGLFQLNLTSRPNVPGQLSRYAEVL